MLNKVILIGRVGKDPETKTTTTGMQVTDFSIATSEKYKGEEKTEWHNIKAFGKLSDIISQYVGKGTLVNVIGKIQTSSWTDQSGVKKYRTEIICNEMKMLGGDSKPAVSNAQSQPAPQPQKPDIDQEFDDIPF
jgi:single-strand DNA-binding protein